MLHAMASLSLGKKLWCLHCATCIAWPQELLLTNKLHGTESSLRDSKACSWLTHSQPFMEPDGPYHIYKNLLLVPVLSQFIPVHLNTPNFFKINFNVIIP
jgi:hypothetical protein